jgi:hypothetical protein
MAKRLQRPGGKYAPLRQYLAGQGEPTVMLTFSAVEAVLGEALPLSAHTSRSWWRNTATAAGWRMAGLDLRAQTVTMTRCSPAPTVSRRPARYAPLGQYLAAVPGPRVTLTFAEIETLVGRPLPLSAVQYRDWWTAPATRSNPQAGSWLSVGWQVAHADLRGRMITFVRQPPDSLI